MDRKVASYCSAWLRSINRSFALKSDDIPFPVLSCPGPSRFTSGWSAIRLRLKGLVSIHITHQATFLQAPTLPSSHRIPRRNYVAQKPLRTLGHDMIFSHPEEVSCGDWDGAITSITYQPYRSHGPQKLNIGLLDQ